MGPEGGVGTSRPEGHPGSDFFGRGGERLFFFLLFFKLPLRIVSSSSGGFPHAPTRAQPPTMRVGRLLPSMGRVWFPVNGTCWDPHPTPRADKATQGLG